MEEKIFKNNYILIKRIAEKFQEDDEQKQKNQKDNE